MDTGYKIGDVMVSDVVTVDVESTVSDCAKLMVEKQVSSVVVTEKGFAVGMITEQDLVRRALATTNDPLRTKVRAIMSSELISLTPEHDINKAAEVMRDMNVKHLAVLLDGKLAGILSAKDIVNLQPDVIDILGVKLAQGRAGIAGTGLELDDEEMLEG